MGTVTANPTPRSRPAGGGGGGPLSAQWVDASRQALVGPDDAPVAIGAYLGEYLWANKPDAATSPPYSRFFATDDDLWKEYIVSPDGTQWVPFVGGFVPRRRALTTVVCGNSIAAISKTNGSFVQVFGSDIHHANQLSGRPMRFELMNAATTRSDVYGVYGYSGQTLPTILADITAQWHDQISGSGVTPELVIGHSLLENDVAGGATVAAMTASLTTWIRLVRAWWPGCLIMLFTPRPSLSNNTAPIVANYAGIVDYMMSLDNGVDIFVTKMDAYESASSPATPAVGSVTGTRSGTTLTVATTSVVLGVGDTLVTDASNNCKITAYGTGTGGAGTYTVSLVGTPSTSAWSVAQYTDASAHPTTRGAMLNARKIKRTFARLGSVWEHPSVGGTAYAISAAMTGTGAASGTNVTGTVPTACIVTGSSNGTFVSTALQPGWQIAVNNNAQGYRTDLATFYQSSVGHIAGAGKLCQFCEVEIVSGAANIGALVFTPRQYYGTAGGANGFVGGMVFNTGDQEGEYEDGDVLLLDTQPLPPPSGGFTEIRNYVRPWMSFRGGTGVAVIKIRSMGAYAPESAQQGMIYAPAASGTVTVDASLGDSVHIIMPAGNITMAAPANPRVGKRLDVSILQDSGGSRTITWNGAFKKAADGAGGANGVGVTSFLYNGANWVQVGGALAFA